MPNMFGGFQFHPDYTGERLRARSKNESVCDGELYVLKGRFVEVEKIDGWVVRYGLDDEDLPVRVRKRFTRRS